MSAVAPRGPKRDRPYAETVRCPGGALCLDFCNTGQGAAGSERREWLAEFADLLDWLERSGALGAEQAKRLRQAAQAAPQPAERVRRRALELRETLRRVIESRLHGHVPAGGDLARFEAEYARALAFARLRWADGRLAWTLDADSDDPAAVLQPIVRSAAELLGSEKLARTRRCANPTCLWLFIDETRNRSRRWCEMASCGNLHKVRRHRARRGAAPANARVR